MAQDVQKRTVLDPPKESTAEAICALKTYGVTTKILTGDNDKVTRTICKQVGLEGACFKITVYKSLDSKGRKSKLVVVDGKSIG